MEICVYNFNREFESHEKKCVSRERERESERVEEATNTNEAMQKKKKAAAENCVKKKVYKRGETEVESRESM